MFAGRNVSDRMDVLEGAWKPVCANRGTTGVDGVSIQSILNRHEALKGLVEEIQWNFGRRRIDRCRSKESTFQIPNGRMRPLGIWNFPMPKRKRIMFEYIILQGINDADKDACELARKLQRIPCRTNLIPYNESPTL